MAKTKMISNLIYPDARYGVFVLGDPDEKTGKRKKTPVSFEIHGNFSRLVTLDVAERFVSAHPNDSVITYTHPKTDSMYLALIDMDDCIRDSVLTKPAFKSIFDQFRTYIELSASGTGLHGLCWIDFPPPILNTSVRLHKNHKWSLEMYWDNGRAIPITANPFCTFTEVTNCTTLFHALHKLLFPDAYNMGTLRCRNHQTFADRGEKRHKDETALVWGLEQLHKSITS